MSASPPKALFLYVLTVLMEVLPAFTLLLGLSLFDLVSTGEALMWLLILAAIIGVIAAVTVKHVPIPRWLSRPALLAFGAAAVAPGILLSRNAVSIIVSILLLVLAYWRGLVAGSGEAEYREVGNRFGVGFGLFFIGLVTVIGRGTIFDRSVWFPIAGVGIAYLMTSMVGMAVARSEREHEGGAAAAIALSVAIQLTLLALVAFIALQIFAINLVGDLAASTSGFWHATGTGIYHFAQLVAKPIDDFISLIRPTHHRTLSNPAPQNPGPNNNFHGKRPKNHPPFAAGLPLTIAGIIVGLFVISAIAYVVWLTLPRLFDRLHPERAREEREWIWSVDGVLQSLLAWMRALFRGGRNVSIGVARGVRRAFHPDYPSDPVRRIYAKLLFQAALAGLVRPHEATPKEFCSLLTERWPEGANHFAVLTTTYEQRRYREVPPEEHVINEMRGHFQNAKKNDSQQLSSRGGLDLGLE